jgi:hypothetical protein
MATRWHQQIEQNRAKVQIRDKKSWRCCLALMAGNRNNENVLAQEK